MTTIHDIDMNRANDFYLAHNDERSLSAAMDRYPECSDLEIVSDAMRLGCYLSYREQGMDHALAAMQACRRSPQMKNSDRTFNQKARHRMDTMQDSIRKVILERAQKAGINTQGKYYCGGLADRRGARDPSAWVSTTSDVLEVARRRNLDVRGAVEHRASESPPPKRVAIAPDILNGLVQKRVASDPALQERVRRNPRAIQAVREELTAKHAKR